MREQEMKMKVWRFQYVINMMLICILVASKFVSQQPKRQYSYIKGEGLISTIGWLNVTILEPTARPTMYLIQI